VLPVWELEFGAMDEGQNRIATAKVKHDVNYQEKLGIVHGPAKDLPPELKARIQSLAKRICRTLELDGYARVDFRLSADGVPYFLEANPNPEIAKIEEFATAAKHDGIKYPELLHRVLLLAIARGKAAGFNAESSGEGSGEGESNGEAEAEGESSVTRNLPHARPARRR
jgi:D-alanine-D-alanine ligase